MDQASLGFGRTIFSDSHDLYRTTVRRFFQNEIEPNVRRWQADGFFDRDLFKKAGKAGILCAGIPEEYGGGGGDLLHHVILHEEHGYSPAGAAMEAGLSTDMVSYLIYLSGTELQKREWLPRFAAGEVISEIGLTEPSGGSDTRGIRTYAKRDGDDYIINGQKMWMANAPIMNMLMVVAKTDPVKDRKGSTAVFIVPFEKGNGVTVAKPTELMLKGAGGVAEVFFDSVRVPKENIVGGEEGKGLSAALGALGVTGKFVTAARSIAACELALCLTLDYVKNRRAFDQRVIDFQNTQFKLATVKTEITVGRTYLDHFLERAARQDVTPTEGAMAKLWATELEGRVMDECLQFFGGYGFSDEFPISKMYAFARVHRIYVGTSEIQRLIIARSL